MRVLFLLLATYWALATAAPPSTSKRFTVIVPQARAGPTAIIAPPNAPNGIPITVPPTIVGGKATDGQRAPQVNKNNCPDVDQCTFLDTFTTRNDRWASAHGYANGEPFDCWWSKNHAVIDLEEEKLRLSVLNVPMFGKNYVGGQLQSRMWHGYGCYEVRMKPVEQEGLISTFFAFTGPYDAAPGFSKAHNEIDVEFVWVGGQMLLQLNYFTNGKGGNERYVQLGFDPSAAFHNYAFRWSEGKIEWFVDGLKIHTAFDNVPDAKKGVMKIMMNLWPVQTRPSGWGGQFRYKGGRNVWYEGVRFTKGQDCKIENKFWYPDE